MVRPTHHKIRLEDPLAQEVLGETHFVALATSDRGGVWASPVYFLYDTRRNELAFRSHPETRHSTNIRDDPQIGFAIFPGKSFPGHRVVGLQGTGLCAPA